jgi:hypothetical protein
MENVILTGLGWLGDTTNAGDDPTLEFSALTASQQAAFEAGAPIGTDFSSMTAAQQAAFEAAIPQGTGQSFAPVGVTNNSWMVMGGVILALILVSGSGGSGRRR